MEIIPIVQTDNYLLLPTSIETFATQEMQAYRISYHTIIIDRLTLHASFEIKVLESCLLC